MENDRHHPDRVTRPPGGIGQRPRLGECGDQQLFNAGVGEPGMTVPGQPPQIGSPDRIWLADQAEFPSSCLAGSCGDRALVPEILVHPSGGPAVGDDTPAVECLAEKVGDVPHRALLQRPGQRERLPGNPGDPGVTVSLDDVMALQSGLVDDMRPGCRRPPPSWEIPLPSVRRGLAKRPRPPEIDQARVIHSHYLPGTAVVRVHKLDTVRQLARRYHREARPGGVHLIRDHKSDCARRLIEISYDTPNTDMTIYEHRYELPGTSPGDPAGNDLPTGAPSKIKRQDDCHDDMSNDMMAVKRHDGCHGTKPGSSCDITRQSFADNEHYVKLNLLNTRARVGL